MPHSIVRFFSSNRELQQEIMVIQTRGKVNAEYKTESISVSVYVCYHLRETNWQRWKRGIKMNHWLLRFTCVSIVWLHSRISVFGSFLSAHFSVWVWGFIDISLFKSLCLFHQTSNLCSSLSVLVCTLRASLQNLTITSKVQSKGWYKIRVNYGTFLKTYLAVLAVPHSHADWILQHTWRIPSNEHVLEVDLLKSCLCGGFFSSNLVLGSVCGREEQLGAGQSGHGGELSEVPGVWPGQGQAVLLQSALHQQVRCQRPLRAERAHLLGNATRWDRMCYVMCPLPIYYMACSKGQFDLAELQHTVVCLCYL